MKNVGISTSRRLIALAVGFRRSQLLLAIGVGLCCSAGLLLTAGSPLNQAQTTDPYVYAGYIHDYTGLIERFGPTYYSERVAYIYPARAFTYLFGLEGGYFAFRLIALASAATAVFAIGMRFYGYGPAILATVWVIFTPWLPRSLLWTYPDGVAVVYVLVGTAFLLVPTQRRLTCHAMAGAAFALAIDCNLFLLAICGLLGPSWAFFYRRESIVWLARAILALAVGFFGIYIGLALLLYAQFPAYGFSFEQITIRTALSLFGGGGEYAPLSLIIWQRHQFVLLIPVTFLLTAFLVLAWRSTPDSRKDFEILATSYLASTICLSLILHFGFHDAWLSLSYYVVYFVPGCALALIVLGGQAQRRGGPLFGYTAVYCGIGLILLSWLARPVLPRSEIASSFQFWLFVAILTVGAAVALRRTAAASIMLVAGSAVLSLSLYKSANSNPQEFSFYDIRLNRGARSSTEEWDVYRGAIFLQQFVNDNVRPNQSIGFWYNDDEYLTSIQSTYLWEYTRVFARGEGMPVVDEQFRNKVAACHFLVLLGSSQVQKHITGPTLKGLPRGAESDVETNVGLGALEAAGLPFREIKRSHFKGKLWRYTAVLIEMKPLVRTLGPMIFNVPIERLEPVNGARISSLAGGVRLTTASPQWAYSLIGRLQPEQGQVSSVHGAIVMRVRLQVEEGKVGVAASTVGNDGRFIREVGVEAAPEMQEVYLDIPDASAAGSVIIRNQSPSGPSRLVVNSVDLLRPEYPPRER